MSLSSLSLWLFLYINSWRLLFFLSSSSRFQCCCVFFSSASAILPCNARWKETKNFKSENVVKESRTTADAVTEREQPYRQHWPIVIDFIIYIHIWNCPTDVHLNVRLKVVHFLTRKCQTQPQVKSTERIGTLGSSFEIEDRSCLSSHSGAQKKKGKILLGWE